MAIEGLDIEHWSQMVLRDAKALFVVWSLRNHLEEELMFFNMPCPTIDQIFNEFVSLRIFSRESAETLTKTYKNPKLDEIFEEYIKSQVDQKTGLGSDDSGLRDAIAKDSKELKSYEPSTLLQFRNTIHRKYNIAFEGKQRQGKSDKVIGFAFYEIFPGYFRLDGTIAPPQEPPSREEEKHEEYIMEEEEIRLIRGAFPEQDPFPIIPQVFGNHGNDGFDLREIERAILLSLQGQPQ